MKRARELARTEYLFLLLGGEWEKEEKKIPRGAPKRPPGLWIAGFGVQRFADLPLALRARLP